MAASIKIRDEDKERLATLQRDYSRLTGRKMTLQETLGLLIRKGRIPLDELTGPAPKATPAQKARLERLKVRGTRRTSSATVDDELYGGRTE